MPIILMQPACHFITECSTTSTHSDGGSATVPHLNTDCCRLKPLEDSRIAIVERASSIWVPHNNASDPILGVWDKHAISNGSTIQNQQYIDRLRPITKIQGMKNGVDILLNLQEELPSKAIPKRRDSPDVKLGLSGRFKKSTTSSRLLKKGGQAQKDDLDFNLWPLFFHCIMEVTIPNQFKISHIESYDDSTDLLDHLESYKFLIMLQKVFDVLLCIVFSTTLQKIALVGYFRLQSSSIHSFEQLRMMFIIHFDTL